MITLLLLALLVLASYYDITNNRLIPLWIVLSFLVLASLQGVNIITLTQALVTFTVLFLLHKYNSFGFGDVILITGIALFLNAYSFRLFLWLIVICLIIEALRRKGRQNIKTPFIPYIFISFMTTLLMR